MPPFQLPTEASKTTNYCVHRRSCFCFSTPLCYFPLTVILIGEQPGHVFGFFWQHLRILQTEPFQHCSAVRLKSSSTHFMVWIRSARLDLVFWSCCSSSSAHPSCEKISNDSLSSFAMRNSKHTRLDGDHAYSSNSL